VNTLLKGDDDDDDDDNNNNNKGRDVMTNRLGITTKKK
jgi:hypothetical protein